MLKKILLLIITLTITNIPTYSAEYIEDNYTQEENVEAGDYCSPKKSIKEKLKNAFVGTPTGFTPQIQPSPYLTPNFGPSYMQGYYSGNNWTSHNIYNPTFPYRLFGTSF